MHLVLTVMTGCYRAGHTPDVGKMLRQTHVATVVPRAGRRCVRCCHKVDAAAVSGTNSAVDLVGSRSVSGEPNSSRDFSPFSLKRKLN